MGWKQPVAQCCPSSSESSSTRHWRRLTTQGVKKRHLLLRDSFPKPVFGASPQQSPKSGPVPTIARGCQVKSDKADSNNENRQQQQRSAEVLLL